MRTLCKNMVDKYLRNSYKTSRMNRFSDSIEAKENNLSIKAGHMQLKEASFEELINESDKLSQKQFTIDDHLSKTNKFKQENNLNSKLFLDVGRSTGVPDVDLSNPKNSIRNANSNSK